MKIEKFINTPVSSNTYVLFENENDSCIIVDPGTPDCLLLFEFLDNHRLLPELIILTHEHFDHTWGCNIIRDKYQCKIVSSKVCAERLSIPQNYFNLLYFNREEEFQVKDVDILLEDVNYNIIWNKYIISFFETPGHTNGSVCFFVDNNLFTGDTLMKGYKPFFKKKDGGSLVKLKQDVHVIFDCFEKQDTRVYPGHGAPFFLYEVREFYAQFLEE